MTKLQKKYKIFPKVNTCTGHKSSQTCWQCRNRFLSYLLVLKNITVQQFEVGCLIFLMKTCEQLLLQTDTKKMAVYQSS